MLLTADYIRKSLEMKLRTMQMLHIGLMLDSEDYNEVFNEFFFDTDVMRPDPGTILAEMPELADIEEPGEMIETLKAGGRHGFLLKIVTPVRKYVSPEQCQWSWSNYYATWFYGDTVPEALNKAYAWAAAIDQRAKLSSLGRSEPAEDQTPDAA